MGAILAEIPAFEGAMRAGPFGASVPRLTWASRQRHDIVITSRQFQTRPTRSFHFFWAQPYELDDLGGGIGRMAFDRHGGSLPVRLSDHRRGSSRRRSDSSVVSCRRRNKRAKTSSRVPETTYTS